MGELAVFAGLTSLSVLCAIMVVISKNPVTSAIFLVVKLFLLAGFYALLGADFIAAIQVIVYAGAIMVLFLFVIMLLNLAPEALEGPRLPLSEIGVLVFTVLGFLGLAIYAFRGHVVGTLGELTPDNIVAAGGNTMVVGLQLFTKYLWPFELASFLILLAIVASVVIARKQRPGEYSVEDGPKKRKCNDQPNHALPSQYP